MGCAASSTCTIDQCSCCWKNKAKRCSLVPPGKTLDQWTLSPSFETDYRNHHLDDDLELVSVSSRESSPRGKFRPSPKHIYFQFRGQKLARLETRSEDEKIGRLSPRRTEPVESQSFPFIQRKKDITRSRKIHLWRKLPQNEVFFSLPALNHQTQEEAKRKAELEELLRVQELYKKNASRWYSRRPGVQNQGPLYFWTPLDSHYLSPKRKWENSSMDSSNTYGSMGSWEIGLLTEDGHANEAGDTVTDANDIPKISNFKLVEELSDEEYPPSNCKDDETKPKSKPLAVGLQSLEIENHLSGASSEMSVDLSSGERVGIKQTQRDAADTHRSETPSPPCQDFSTPGVLSLLDRIDGRSHSSSDNMTDFSSAYPKTSSSASPRDHPDLSDEGISDTSLLDSSNLSDTYTTQMWAPKPHLSPQSRPTSAPALRRVNFSSNSVNGPKFSHGDNLQNWASHQPLPVRSPTWVLSAAKSTGLRTGGTRGWSAKSSMEFGDHRQSYEGMDTMTACSNVHLHVNFFNDFGDNFDDELDFM